MKIIFQIMMSMLFLFSITGCTEHEVIPNERDGTIKEFVVMDETAQKSHTFDKNEDVILLTSVLDDSMLTEEKLDMSEPVYKVSLVYRDGGAKNFIFQLDKQTNSGWLMVEGREDGFASQMEEKTAKKVIDLFTKKGDI